MSKVPVAGRGLIDRALQIKALNDAVDRKIKQIPGKILYQFIILFVGSEGFDSFSDRLVIADGVS